MFFLLSLIAPMKWDAEEKTSPSPTVSRDKIEGLREEIEKKVQEKLDDIVSQQEKRGWIGIITEVTATGFKIEVNEEARTVTLSDEATVIDQNRQEIEFDDLAAEDRVIAMGYEQIDGTLDGRRIVIVDEKEPRVRQSIFGTVTETAEQDEIMLVKNGSEKYELIFDENSVLEQRTNGETKEIEYEDLTADQKVAAVVSPTDGNTATYTVEKLLVVSSPEPAQEPEAETGTTSTETGSTASESGTTASETGTTATE